MEQAALEDKVASVRRLAGGVAHDFNNLLTVVGGAAELIAEDPTARDSVVDLVQEIRSAQEKASRLTRQLLAFAQRQVSLPRHVSLGAEVAFRQEFLRTLVPRGIVLEVSVPTVDPTVLADREQLGEILASLVSNAAEAMGGRGRIEVEVEEVELTTWLEGPAGRVPSGIYAALRVTDEGPGVPPELRDRIFEPFVSGGDGLRSGLGLSAVLGMVRQASGQIVVDTPAGGGTRFSIFLPRVHRETPAPV